MTDPVVQQALPFWGLQGADVSLLAQRENHVYAVRQGATKYALRLHRPGYRTAPELVSELDWMMYLSQQGLHVPAPIPTHDGSYLAKIGTIHVSLLTWLDGTPIGEGSEISEGSPTQIARMVGREMARLHDLTDNWDCPNAFVRPNWTADALLGENPLWGRFWEHPHLSPDQKNLLLKTRSRASLDLHALEADAGLIHADLLTENILLWNDGLGILDFDDCAIGYRSFELATFLLRYVERSDFCDIRTALSGGYAARRAIPAAELDLMLLLRALTYVGWIIPRLHEPGGETRSNRMIARATSLANTYLEGRPS
ncbi:phosphotransferase enzyme family protein [Shimia sp. W99]